MTADLLFLGMAGQFIDQLLETDIFVHDRPVRSTFR
jgi:hypothetical protein